MKKINDAPDDLDAAALASRTRAVVTNDMLVGFLYLVMRDHLTPGQVEYLMLQISKDLDKGNSSSFSLTNGHLARYAEDVAGRLKGVIKQRDTYFFAAVRAGTPAVQTGSEIIIVEPRKKKRKTRVKDR